MKSIIKLMLVMVLAVSVSVLFAVAKGDAKKGQVLYTGKCQSCHGDKGVGKPDVEKMLGAKILPFSSKEVQSMTDEEIGKMISLERARCRPPRYPKQMPPTSSLIYERLRLRLSNRSPNHCGSQEPPTSWHRCDGGCNSDPSHRSQGGACAYSRWPALAGVLQLRISGASPT